jgi:hypothetical protein
MRRDKLTYGNVVSTAAVFLALGGVSWAAATLPKNSVGGAQIKADSVQGKHVQDGSLAKADFAQGVAGTHGAAGQKGVVGDVGPIGLRGERGAGGPAGPSGDTGAQGPTGPVGGVPCQELFCPGVDNAGRVEVTVDGAVLIGGIKAYKIRCGVYACRVLLGGDAADVTPLQTWFAQTEAGTPALKSGSLNIYAPDDVIAFRYHLTDMFPTALVVAGGRYQAKLTMSFLQRVSV